MHGRCRDKSAKSYPQYGGRGITVCARWRSFENFFADMGPRPEGMSIDRLDNDKGYEPSNCRWLPLNEQHYNCRNNRMVEYDGKRLNLEQWARQLGMSRNTIERRLSDGWPLDLVFTTKRFYGHTPDGAPKPRQPARAR